MIAEISSGTNPVSMVLYNENKVTTGSATRIFSNNFLVENKEMFNATFKHLIAESSVEEPTRHISINLPPGEKVSDETFQNIAQEYMEQLGYGNQPYVVYRHLDRPHEHIHIVTVNIDDNGRKINDFFEYKRSQKITRMLEKKYNLTQVSSTKESLNSTVIISPDKQLEYKDLFDKKGVKIAIARATMDLKSNYKPTNLVDVKKILVFSGIETKTILNEDNSLKGLQFSMQDDPNHKPILASDLYHSFSLPYLDKLFEKNQKFKRSVDVIPISVKIQSVLDQSSFFSENQFKLALNGRGIEPVFDRYADGRAYGLSFLDLENGCLFKASEISRSLSFGKLKARFTAEDYQIGKNDLKNINLVISDVYTESLKEWKDLQTWASSQSLFLTSQDVSSILKFKLPLIDSAIIDGFVADKEKFFQTFEAFNKLLKDNFKDIAHQMSALEIFDQVKNTPQFAAYGELVKPDKINQTILFFIESRIKIEDEKRRRPIIETIIQSYKEHIKEKFPDNQAVYFVGKESREKFVLSLQNSTLVQDLTEKDKSIVIKESSEKAIWVDDKALSSRVKQEILNESKLIINSAYNECLENGSKLGDYYRLLAGGDELVDKLSAMPAVVLLNEKLKLLGKEELYEHHIDKIIVKLKQDLIIQADTADRKDLLKEQLKYYYSTLNNGTEKLKLFELIEDKSSIEGFVLHLESSKIFESGTPEFRSLILKEAEELIIWEKENRVPPLKLSDYINEKVKEFVNKQITEQVSEKLSSYTVLRSLTMESFVQIFKDESNYSSFKDYAENSKFKGDLEKILLDTLAYAVERNPDRADKLERTEVIMALNSEYYELLLAHNPDIPKYLLIKDYSDHNEFFDFIKGSDKLSKFDELQRHKLLCEAIDRIEWDKDKKVLPLYIEDEIRGFIRGQVANGKVGGVSVEEVYRLMSHEGYLESALETSGVKDRIEKFSMQLGKQEVFEKLYQALVDKHQDSFPKKADEMALSKFINEQIRDVYVFQFKQSGIKLESVYINNFLRKQILIPQLQQSNAVKDSLAQMLKAYPEFKPEEFLDKLVDRFIQFKFDRLEAIKEYEEQQQRQTYADIIGVLGAGNTRTGARPDKKNKKGRKL